MEDAILECGGLTQERPMTMRRTALQASLALDHKRRWKRASHHATNHCQGELQVGQPFGSGDVARMQPRKTNECFLAPGRCHQHCLPRVRSQVCTISGATVSR